MAHPLLLLRGMTATSSQHTSLTSTQRESLLERIETGVKQTSRSFIPGMVLVVTLFAAMTLLFGFGRGAWGIAAITGAAAVGFLLLGLGAMRRTSPERNQTALHTLRAHPETIYQVRHFETSDSKHVFVTHWIEIDTHYEKLRFKANNDWRQLLVLLSLYCPQAQVVERG